MKVYLCEADGMKGASADPLHFISTRRGQDDSLSASQLSAQHDSKLKDAAAPTAEALGSLMCLVEACLSTGHMPTPEEAVTEAQNDGESPAVHPRTQFCHVKVPDPCQAQPAQWNTCPDRICICKCCNSVPISGVQCTASASLDLCGRCALLPVRRFNPNL